MIHGHQGSSIETRIDQVNLLCRITARAKRRQCTMSVCWRQPATPDLPTLASLNPMLFLWVSGNTCAMGGEQLDAQPPLDTYKDDVVMFIGCLQCCTGGSAI